MKDATSDRSRREFALVWVWLALVLSVSVGVVVAVLLWGTTRAEHRDAFDTGWKSAAAVLAVLAAFVTVERLRLGQREHQRQLVADQATHITDLSSKASEQLGSDKAAVRIGGLTDLERLAQSYPELRQTVVDRVCAYLRAPYQLPPDRPDPASGSLMDTNNPGGSAPELSDETVAARRLELDVRRTAQQILYRHLRWPADVEKAPDSFWAMIDLDLRDATLVETNLVDCHIGSADFRNTTFHRRAVFDRVTFTGDAWFVEATFTGDAWFEKATFAQDAWFERVTFTGDAEFGEATFTQSAVFDRVTFTGDARFVEATFTADAWFVEAIFEGEELFSSARVVDLDAEHSWPPGWEVADIDLYDPPGVRRLEIASPPDFRQF